MRIPTHDGRGTAEMVVRREAIRSALLQATFLSSSVFLVGAMPPYARAQVVCSGTTAGGCIIGPDGLVSANAIGANGANSTDTHHPGGAGVAGGSVTLTSPAPGGPPALNASVNGGNGGNGYNADGVTGSASHGGNGGNGGGIVITNQGAITTTGGYNAISAWAIGGTGGTGGAANFNNGAQRGGPGGDGGSATVHNTGAIVVTGANTAGILAFGLGGDGGIGGAGDYSAGHLAGPSGNGGYGGAAVVTNGASITTEAANSIGIYVATTGGAGGNGAGYKNSGAYGSYAGNGGGGAGAAALASGAFSFTQPLTPLEGMAEVQNSGDITTNGLNSSGIWVWGAGGAGGNVGYGSTSPGGKGGNGGTAYVSNTARILVSGDAANGIGVTTTGGVGGQGGYHTDPHGGAGGTGGRGGAITIVTTATSFISTNGTQAYGILANSEGGSGGAAGFGDGYSAAGGNGGNAGSVFITNAGSITTSGASSDGIHASVAGGAAPPELFTVAEGGGVGGNGGMVSVGTTGNITVSGDGSSAIFLNASGGAGGYGKNGGAGGNAGTASLYASGSINVSGENSSGIAVFAEGGTGGTGGVDADNNRGAGGAGGNGNSVTVVNRANILATGPSGTGILINTSGGDVGEQSQLITPQSAGSAGSVSLKSFGLIEMTGTGQNTGISVNADGGNAFVPESGFTGPSPAGNAATVTASIYGSVMTAGLNLSNAIAISATGGSGGLGSLYSTSAAVGAGGNGAAINVTVANLFAPWAPQIISTVGSNSPAVTLNANGGQGGSGSSEDDGKYQGAGAVGGNAGNVTLTITGDQTQITTAGSNSPGISASAVGGYGGCGCYSSDLYFDTNSGGKGGSTGIVTIVSGAAITTSGSNSPGIYAQAGGGGGGDSGVGTSAVGGAGGSGAVVGDVITVSNKGSIATSGYASSGIVIQSTGGNGGAGVMNGAIGGAGGPSGDVQVTNWGEIVTTGEDSHGIAARSVGGGGGASSTTTSGGLFIKVQGGVGASGAQAGSTTIFNYNAITTTGSASNGIFASSTGGGGGTGGSISTLGFGLAIVPSVTVDIGGAGGSGAAGGAISITNGSGANITTAGTDSAAIRAVSIGGAGGFGGQSNASVFTAGVGEYLPSFAVSIAVAGSGGTGGDGGAIDVTNLGSITTFGDQSAGIRAASTGGGGGDGGNAMTHDYTLGTGSSASLNVTIGGSGGTGGDGGAITLNNNNSQGVAASIMTLGFASDAIQLTSIGGGGGDAGTGTSRVETVLPGQDVLDYIPFTFGESTSMSISVGGNGGGGGNGGAIGDHHSVVNDYALTTYGADSRGIYAMSTGGGGGTAASGKAVSAQSITGTVSLGGSGGAGGDGGKVEIDNASDGVIKTAGDGSHGIFAQSIGGGGGWGGTSTSDIDGTQGTAAAEVASQYVIAKILSQIKSLSTSDLVSDVSPSASITVSVGGSGGAGGDGGKVELSNEGVIKTGVSGGGGGDFAVGIFGQSVGGGGGTGGSAEASGARLINTVNQVGGTAGAFGSGGEVDIGSTGEIATSGNIAFGVLAQSIGGGGGAAGLAPGSGQIDFDPGIRLGGAIADAANTSSGGGTVSVTTTSVTTAGNEAHAIVAQSIGGGGGLFFINQENNGNLPTNLANQFADAINAADPGLLAQLQTEFATLRAQSSGSLTLTLGGTQLNDTQGDGDGSGGAATVENQGTISTSGLNALGVLAQSIGGGGGFLAEGPGVDVSTMSVSGMLGNASSGSVNQAGGKVTVTLDSGSEISTTGNGATAVVAQSIGGGGGYTGALNASGVSYQDFLSPTAGYLMTVGANTEGGGVSIVTQGLAKIETTGANAHGIVAQSLSGGGGLVADGNGIIIPTGAGGVSRAPATASSGFAPGTVSINFTGTLETTGNNSVAIFAQSGTQDSSGAIDRTLSMVTSGNIDVNILAGSKVVGGSGVYAITLDGGATNTITIGDQSTLSSLSNLAVSSGWGTNTLSNSGTITGNIALGGSSTFDNAAGGVYVSALNGTVSLGGTSHAGGRLSNSGIVNVAGVGTISTLTVNGTFAQSAAGSYLADVNSTGAGSSDLITATDVGPTVSGAVLVNVVDSIGPKSTFLILKQTDPSPITTVTAATTGLSIVSAQQSAVKATWTPTTTADQLTITPNLTFAPDDLPLGDNERAYADHLQKTWDNGGSEKLDRVYAELFNLPSQTAYQKALASATPTVLATGSLGQTLVARDRLNAVQSCPEFDDESGTGTLLVQRDCAWGRIGGGKTDFTPSNATGYTINQMTYATGFQKELAPDWFVGMSASYMADTYSNTSGLSSATGQGVDVTAVLKREMGQWLVSGALNLGYGWYDAARWTAVGSNFYQSDSSYNVFTAAARLRADYEFPFQNWYLKPFGQLDLLYASTPGYDEGGHGSLYDLSVAGSDNVSVAIGPHLEVGGRVNFSDGSVLRPYAQAGVTWFSNSDWQVSAALQGAPNTAGTFRTAVDAPNLLADLTLGLQWSLPRGIDLRVNYEANLGDNFTAQSGMARVSVNF